MLKLTLPILPGLAIHHHLDLGTSASFMVWEIGQV
ncbi:hypothetical protein LYNGBM3L_06390 [Moorena producens 3L]|uniref:Uncharacterized protein n=1 Tax=Moorena producens 3L TaxID=489825 RepID=F4XJG9_9CYAN|nr:hypothetical protein LYNGBM3L_06390 [Moorena producens 3L]